jgi:hypothetical protein
MRFCQLFLLGAAALFAGDPWDEMFEQPLVNWALEIGGAKSLPLSPGYDLDALEFLTPEAPVLARMETIRRTIVHSRKDPRLAYRLLAALSGRVREAEGAGKPEPLAWFDLGYAFEAARQAAWLKKELLPNLNGYSLVMQAIRVLGDADPRALDLQFAAGLMLLEPKGQHPYYPHFKTVVRGTAEGSLLEKNLLLHLARTFEATTLEGMRKSRYLR